MATAKPTPGVGRMVKYFVSSVPSNIFDVSNIVHKLRGGNRYEPVNINSMPTIVRKKAAKLLAAGELGLTTGYSSGELVDSDYRLPLEDAVADDLAEHGAERLTPQEIGILTAALAARVEL